MWGVPDLKGTCLKICRGKKRAGLYVDGFNLYHALHELRRPHLKWLDLWALGERRIDRRHERLVRVVFCSAYPTHLNDGSKILRHRAYVAALKARGVECHLGRFKKRRPTRCRECGHSWQTHEEKESDVTLALRVLHDVHLGRVDHVYLLSGDSDFAGLARLFREAFPKKKLFSVAPTARSHSKEVLRHAHDKRKLTPHTLAQCLLPAEVRDGTGNLVAVRPSEYDPPVV